MNTFSRRLAVAATAVILPFALVACSGDSGSGDDTESPAEPPVAEQTSDAPADEPSEPSDKDLLAAGSEISEGQLASPDDMALVPEDVLAKGSIEAATTDANAPWVFFEADTTTAAGVDAELINEAAKRLGLTVNWQNVQFTAAIPGVESGRFDLYVSAMADTKEREKAVNFIAYSTEGSGVIVPKGNPKNITTMADLCGLNLHVLTGSMFPPILEEMNQNECKDNNVKWSEDSEQTAPLLAVASGQADATMNTFGVSNYTFKTATDGVQTQLEMSPVEIFAPAHQGMAFSKDQPDLMRAIAGAMQSMVEDGTYQAIFDKWEVSSGALDQITMNDAMS